MMHSKDLRLGYLATTLATTLAMSTQCDYNVIRHSMNRRHLQFRLFERQPSVFAMRPGST